MSCLFFPLLALSMYVYSTLLEVCILISICEFDVPRCSIPHLHERAAEDIRDSLAEVSCKSRPFRNDLENLPEHRRPAASTRLLESEYPLDCGLQSSEQEAGCTKPECAGVHCHLAVAELLALPRSRPVSLSLVNTSPTPLGCTTVLCCSLARVLSLHARLYLPRIRTAGKRR